MDKSVLYTSPLCRVDDCSGNAKYVRKDPNTQIPSYDKRLYNAFTLNSISGFVLSSPMVG